MKCNRTAPVDGGKQRGHLMAGLMCLIAIKLIFATMVFQAWEDVLQRDKEAEMIFRGQEIARAIQRYRLDHGGAPPTKLEQLAEPGTKEQYYIRQMYEDPLVLDGKWGLLFLGPDGQVLDPAQSANAADPFAGTSIFDDEQDGTEPEGQGSRLDSLLGGSAATGGQPGAPGSAATGLGGTPGGGLGGVGNRRNSSGGEGGLPIAGVRTLADGEPFRHYKGLSDYAQWQFTFLDLELQQPPGGQQGRQGQGTGGPRARPGKRPRDRKP